MANNVRSVDFLPPIFQTDANKQFLAATLDQLVQEPQFKKTQGFIGRTVGPGVNPNDKYVIEPNKTRADYQLEPGVISLDPTDTNKIKNAITYPGINDAIGYARGDQSRPDRLYQSEFYTWDPFVDFDTYINFSQYFWIPGGPDPVDVSATGIPASDEFVVTRENGVYTFSGVSGDNPTIELVRGGNYTFQVAQNEKETVNYRVQNQGTQGYKIDYQLNPTLTLVRGNTYVFNLALNGIYPFWIKVDNTLGIGNSYDFGVSRNGASAGLITFTVPQDAPDTLYYVCQDQLNMQGVINIVDGVPGTGPGFWIQSAPGVNGRLPQAPNISSRDVYGVVNNGEDLGTITFNVPQKTAQDFYYNLNSIGTIDMISTLKYDQINNANLVDFILTYGGIDGNTYLNNKTLVFNITEMDPVAGGWLRYDFNDPLAEPTVIPFEDRYQIYTIQLFKGPDGLDYINLIQTGTIAINDVFNINYGNVYSKTNWFKNDQKYLERVPLLTATQDILYYQDGTDPEIFGQIKLIEYTENTTLYVENIIGKKSYTSPNGVVFTNGLKVVLRGDVVPTDYANKEFYVSGVGSYIELLPVTDFICPESYVIDASDSAIPTEPTEIDYLTIERSAKNLNAWSRSNRWFHIDVINATAEYNHTAPILDNNYRAKRPILQFRGGLRLFNMGTEGKQPVDIIDFTETDAFSNVEGSTSYSSDGYTVVEGSRIIFAADEDANVRNKIWVVKFITPDSVLPLIAQPIINLVPAEDSLVLADQSVVCLEGSTEKGITYWFDGTNWIKAQQKLGVQQAPLFNVYDVNGYSYSDKTKYTSSSFAGSKLYSYAVGDTSIIDPVLKFPLQYLNINNVGDIVFDNNLYVDSFVYVQNNLSVEQSISDGYVKEYSGRTTFRKRIGWQTAATETQQRQQFKFVYNGSNTLKLDVAVSSNNVNIPAIKIYVGSVYQDPTTYTYLTTADSTIITLNGVYLINDVIEVLALSEQTSQVAFYQVPYNLESNPLNGNSKYFTLGTARQHYESICQNLTSVVGKINGANNSRDLGNVIPYGLIVLQHSSPLTLAGYFLRSNQYNIFSALQYNMLEYVNYKNKMLEAVTQQTIQFENASEILDVAIQNITEGKVENQPFYWSDMLPSGAIYELTTYTVTPITTNTFDTVQVYNYKSANYLGMNVYLNGVLLTRDLDYTVATDGPRIIVLTTLTPGDTVTIQEYSTTVGSFCPNTPTKMGLYPAWRPGIVTINTQTGPQQMIRGHDGSLTVPFNDIRDNVLLEFETRIFNNLKLDDNPVPLTIYDVLPGQFRDTGFTYSEINNIFAQDFLSYCGWNKLDYKTQNYVAGNEFSYNYSDALNVLNNQNLLGAWRGINRYFYDTIDPESFPWEMLGFTIKPSWWEDVYGPGPYTGENLVLWDDLAAGYVADPIAPYFLTKFARPASYGPVNVPKREGIWGESPYPQLSPVIPTGSSGELLSPLNVQLGVPAATYQKSWAVGDGGPVEASWWNSSAYPFSVMHVLAVTRPAKFFALFADRDLYKFDTDYNQYLYNQRYRLDANGLEIYGNGTSKASYINWIVDYNRQSGLDSTDLLTKDLKNLDVRLCYRMASFSDKQYIKLYTEKSSPNSTNTTLEIPSESYNLLLYKNQPFERASYSSVVIQKVSGGYAVFGYSSTQPYFDILAGQYNGRVKTISAGGKSVQTPVFFTNKIVKIPYGYIFTNESGVVDFLLGYGAFLETQGLTFTNLDNGYVLNWDQMANEFLYWSQQGWNENALINLNPLAFKLEITNPTAIVDSIAAQTAQDILLDQNKRELPTRNLNIVRIGNTFTVEPLAAQTLSYIDLKYTSYEHMIVLNNQSVFGDLIYAPITGARQSRLMLICANTTNWTGALDAPGFILNQNNVEEWTGLRTYSKGEIVKYKNVYWAAAKIVQPTTKFDFNDWYQSDYSQIELGLLPNIANKANQLANSYDINSANLDSDNNLLSYGLIGFRPRQYMAALNLDDVSQVNVYRQFLGSKGTLLSVELFGQANLGKEAGDYSVYENWAIQRSIYGASANKSFVDLRLERNLLDANPSIIQVINPYQSSQADQAIEVQNVWRESYKLTSPNFLPTTTEIPSDISLPTAGYVNLNDADITVFDINDPSSLAANIDNINVGTSVWVAKINDYDWGIYRAEQVPGQILHVCDNLDETSRVIFSKQHGLSKGDKLIIKFFDSEVNGVYTVVGIVDLNTVNIVFQFTGKRTVADGNGIGFTLKTMRVAQASDITQLPYAQAIPPGAKVWVDNLGNNRWGVLEKNDVFDSIDAIGPQILEPLEQYGQSVAQANTRSAAFVGSPRYGFLSGYTQGGVYVYIKAQNDQYTPVSPLDTVDAVLTLDVEYSSGVPAVRNLGASLTFGNQTYGAAGAPASLGPTGTSNNGVVGIIYKDPALGQPGFNPFTISQMLYQPGTSASYTPGAGEFGYSVAMSADERWLYVGAPGLNQVHAYGYVDWQDQFYRVRGDGYTDSYDVADYIQFSTGTQLTVSVDGKIQTLGTDFTVAGTVITFATPPGADILVSIQRNNNYYLDYAQYFNVAQSATSGSGVNARFSITRTRGEVSVGCTTAGSGYAVGNTITIPATSFGGGSVPANNITLTVTSIAAGGKINSFTTAYTPPTLTTVFSLNEYLFNATNIYSFSIFVDNVLQRPNIDYTFNATTKDITFLTSPAAGSLINAVSVGYYEFVDTLEPVGINSDARFGTSIACSTDGRQVVIGAPNATVDGNEEGGLLYVFDRNVQRFIYGAETTSNTITLLGSVNAPVSVIVNNEFLINENNGIVGATNTFSWNGSNSISIVEDLIYGDDIEIETNQFSLIQVIKQHTLEEFSNYGTSVDMCVYNCSLYSGAPQSSYQVFKGGVVERNLNQSRLYGITTSTKQNPTLTVGNTLRVNNIDIEITDGTLETLASTINSTAPNVSATVSNGYLTIAVSNPDAAPVGNKVQVLPGSIGTAFEALSFETYVFTEVIESPYPIEQAKFGQALTISDSATELVIGSTKGTLYLPVDFDNGTTYFDAKTTIFFDTTVQSGAVYLYNLFPSASPSVSNPSKFIFGQQIYDPSVQPLDNFGQALSYRSGILLAGAPGQDINDSSSADFGRVFVFSNNARLPAWSTVQEQQPTVDVRLLNSIYFYDRVSGAKTEFLDFFNPLQGKILGAAAENIDYITALDPANYNVGPSNITGASWSGNQLGQVWWDVSTIRFIDPNQDNIVYAAKRWGQTFPGSTADVYQWIVSPVPPAEYTGPGVPYNFTSYVINSVLTQDGTFSVEYYFWVKNISTVNTLMGKSLSIATVAQYIENPIGSGIAYLAPINSSTVAVYNSSDYILANDTILSIEYDKEYTQNNVHFEYELVPQDKGTGFLSANLYRKMQDSFCGVDTFGNKVPDMTLSPADRYGVQFRPRQSMFADRFAALKNYLTRVNAVMAMYPISESKSFSLLDSSEPIPPSNSVTDPWNKQVANLEILSYQDIYSVPLGYKYLVTSDSDNHGYWTIYQVQRDLVDPNVRQLVLYRVQLYYTPGYWNYINWYEPGYNSSTKPIVEVPNYSALNTIDVPIGSSVKVTANAQGKWEIYIRTPIGWSRVGLQDGTIEISAVLWDYALGRYGFDVEVFDAQYFDQEPVIETRKVIQAINDEILIDNLALARNRALVLMFNFILSEFQAPSWLVKTSLIDVDHNIRQLIPYQNYIRDNQEFVSDYIQEVKPYHVQVREFNLIYSGEDTYTGDLTDFDVPAFYASGLEIPQYISPILLPYAHSTWQPFNDVSDAPYNSTVWDRWPYSQWVSNYLLAVEKIDIIDQGTGYTTVPEIIIGEGFKASTVYATGQQFNVDSLLFTVYEGGTSGNTPPLNIAGLQNNGTMTVALEGTIAEATALLNSLGQVVDINIVDTGYGYRYTPTIVINGGNGVGARAYPRMNYTTDAGGQFVQYAGLARSIRTTIKYDRVQYIPTVVEWSPEGTYENGTLVRYNDSVWRAENFDGSSANVGPDFNLEDWVPVTASELSGVDRTIGYYVPGPSEPGIEAGLLIPGIDYPGVQVWGDYFLGSNPLGPAFTCTATNSTNNSITCETTLGLDLNAPVKFYGDVFGSIIPGKTYYIKSIIDTTRFTISGAAGGSVQPLTTATGSMLARVPQLLDTVYESEFTDPYLGDRFTDINVEGGKFIGPYEGHAPEELVNGSEFDTLDMRIRTRPGSDWDLNGHGWLVKTIRYEYSSLVANKWSWAGLVEVPFQVLVYNATTGVDVTAGVDYSVDWAGESISILNNFTDGDVININVYEIGGSSQLYKHSYSGVEIIDNSVVVPVNNSEIYTVVVFANGVQQSGYTWEPYIVSVPWDQYVAYAKLDIVNNSGIYYRAIQDVPAGTAIDNSAYWYPFIPSQGSIINFNESYLSTDRVSVLVIGVETPTQHSWSTPITENFVVNEDILINKYVTLSAYVGGSNSANMVVTRNGLRLQPYEGIEWIGDGSSTSFGLPQRGNYEQSIINAPTDISVWVNNELQQQNYGTITTGTYSVTGWTGSNTPGRQVVFLQPPEDGAEILISVSTNSDYYITGNTVEISSTLNLGDIISVTTWNDTSQLNPLTLVFVGPVKTAGLTITETYDSTPFDEGSVTGGPGSFDYSAGTTAYQNSFDLERIDVNPGRLWVTKNGYRLSEGVDFTVNGQYMIFNQGVIGFTDVVAVTEFTNSVVPEQTEFRIFQDMRGVQATYRMTPQTTTYLTQPLSATANIAYVDDVRKLTEPNLLNGIFGVVTINGERIMYRDRDLVNNTILGLRRGTAGTGAANHDAGASVYDMGLGNLLPMQYQDYYVTNADENGQYPLGDGSTTIFPAPNINLSNIDPEDSTSAFIDHSIEVYVGGIKQQPYSETNATSQYRYIVGTVTPVSVEFIVDENAYPPLTAPAAGSEVKIVQRRGTSWYNTGADTPATAIKAGEQWWISSVGTTDFTAIGASHNEVGIFFTATGPGTGTGTVKTASDGIALQETDTFQARFLTNR